MNAIWSQSEMAWRYSRQGARGIPHSVGSCSRCSYACARSVVGSKLPKGALEAIGTASEACEGAHIACRRRDGAFRASVSNGTFTTTARIVMVSTRAAKEARAADLRAAVKIAADVTNPLRPLAKLATPCQREQCNILRHGVRMHAGLTMGCTPTDQSRAGTFQRCTLCRSTVQ